MKVERLIEEFLFHYPCMALRPTSGDLYSIEGYFPVAAQYGDDTETYVYRKFHLRLEVPLSYPDSLPRVYEVGDGALIPTQPEFHKNNDSSLCLGSPEALFSQIERDPSLVSYAQQFIVPYLASAILLKEKGIPFRQGELKHGNDGLEQDFESRYGLKLPLKVIVKVYSLLGEKARSANKRLCPCKACVIGKCRCVIKRFIISERRKATHSRRAYRNIAMEQNKYVKPDTEGEPQFSCKHLCSNKRAVLK